MSSISYRHSFAILCCALPFAASAQTSTSIPSLDNIVVTASRSAQLQSEVIGDVTVIDKKELERAGQTSIAEVLAKQPGVQFYSSGGPQTVTGVYLRGTNPNQTLVMIDGVRVNSSIQGTVNWNTIDPATIERIEIVRGAASSLYGSDAIGGVINIITTSREDRPLSAWANLGYGTHDTVESSLGMSGASNGWNYRFAISSAKSDGYDATNENYPYGREPDKDGYHRHSISGALGYQLDANNSVQLTAYNSYVNADYDVGNPAASVTAKTRQQAYTVSSVNKINDLWQSTVRLGLSKDEYDDRAWGTKFSNIQRSYTWQNDFALTENQTIALVLERLEERPTHSNNYPVNRRDTNSAAGVYRGDFGRHHVQASIRNDTITGYKKKTTGGLGYEFDVSDSWAVSIGANTGFRMPTFTDLYSPWAPNPDVKPETSTNIEAGIKYRTEKSQLSLVAYQNKLRDLITLDPNRAFAAYNIDRATIRGATLAGEHRLGNTTLRGSASLMNPRDDKTRKQLIRRAKQVYNLGISHRLNAWDLGAEYQFVGKRYDNAANDIRLGSHSLVNLTAAYDFTKNVGVQVRWNNVFDKNYTNAYGYNMPGSNVFVNLSFRM